MQVKDLTENKSSGFKAPGVSQHTVRVYAERLALGVKHLAELKKNKEVSAIEIAHLHNAVKYDIKWLSLVWPHDASEGALALAAGKVDLFKLTYVDQPKAEKIISDRLEKGTRVKDGVLMHEHKTDVATLFQKIEATGGDVDKIIQILNGMELVWILRSEDKKLKRSHRGDDHDKAYADAGIVVVKNPLKRKIV